MFIEKLSSFMTSNFVSPLALSLSTQIPNTPKKVSPKPVSVRYKLILEA